MDSLGQTLTSPTYTYFPTCGALLFYNRCHDDMSNFNLVAVSKLKWAAVETSPTINIPPRRFTNGEATNVVAAVANALSAWRGMPPPPFFSQPATHFILNISW